jgi:hypothetical protein
MMTTLAQLVWDCSAIGGMDKLILMGWAEQVPDGSDLAYASKETVAEFLELGISTVQRRTKALVKRGCLIDTGGKKRWKNGWTPVYQVNTELLIGQPVNVNGVSDCPPVQIDRQGSNGSVVLGLDVLSSSSACSATGVPPVVASKSKEVGQTETAKPKPKPTPTPTLHAHGKGRSCSKCGEALERDVNHFLVCKVAKGNSPLDEYLGDLPPRPNPDSLGELMNFDEDDGYDGTPVFPSVNSPQAEEARQKVDVEREKSVQSRPEEGRTTPAANASHAQPPVAPAPLYLCMVCGKVPVRSPTSDYCAGCWNNGSPMAIPKGAVPKTVPNYGISP